MDTTWKMTALVAALEPTDAETCLEVATSLVAIIRAALASDQAAIKYETDSVFFEMADAHASWRVTCQFAASRYMVSILPLGRTSYRLSAGLGSAADAATFINAMTIKVGNLDAPAPVADSRAMEM